MQKAIKRAIEGGYLPHITDRQDLLSQMQSKEFDWNSYLLDPEFWKCLGKAEGWEELEGNGVYPVYRDKWHQLIDHLVKGKDIDSFFDNLLK